MPGVDINSEATDSIMPTPPPEEFQVKLRSYQEEMLEASLKQNTIVAMDTGSGKTHVAIFRILAELERSDPSKLVWFMSPSVALSEQQYHVLTEHLPGYLVKTLLGRDGVDKWSDQRLWDAVLTNVRVVVGTPAVLEQALTHGFVHMSRLALLVFDEAHRCIKGGPMNTIVKNFYHAAKNRGEIPHILGLTASPVMSAKAGDLEQIEANLDAIAISPKRHRSELELHVHRPEVSRVVYNSITNGQIVQPLCLALNHAVESYDLSTDPYIIELQGLDDESSQRQLRKLAEEPKTFCMRQLKALRQRSNVLLEQLGPAAAEWYVRECVNRFLKGIQADTLVLPDITEKERRHLASIFDNLTRPNLHSELLDNNQKYVMTDKVRSLINVLNQHASPSLRGTVFVEQRATVYALVYLLRQQPEIRRQFSIGTFVGLSNIYNKTPIADLAAAKEQQQDLVNFRNGDLNLMIATNVLEEGIDVSACNLVVCFDPPKTLVSFVHRRGRARQKDSKYVVFLGTHELKSDPSKWQRLEAEMKQAYMDELRVFKPTEPEDNEASDSEVYRIDSTGAVLTLENAKPHIQHFCAVSTLHTSRYIELRPTFETTNNGGHTPYTAHVVLPSFVHPDLRTASSSQAWRSETSAIKDAAFQAYVALHKAGLVNDNLLPLVKDYGPDEGQIHVDQPSVVEVSEQLSFWRRLFQRTGYDGAAWHAGTLTLSLNGKAVVAVWILLPTALPEFLSFPLYWNQHATYVVEIQPRAGVVVQPDKRQKLDRMRHFTQIMLSSVHGNRMSTYLDDFSVLFCRVDDPYVSFPSSVEGAEPATTLLHDDAGSDEQGLVRVKDQTGRAYIFSGIAVPDNAVDDSAEAHVIVTAFPKRRDFLHPVISGDAQNTAHTAGQSFPINECTVDKLPAKYARLAAFVPSIMHRIDVAMLAQVLQRTKLAGIGINDSSLVTEAISAPSAGEAADYNRLEFLGDSILKFCTVLQVLTQHPYWPEGYLQLEKDRIVNNNNLTKAAIQAKLDKFILTNAFTGSKWRPVYISELLAANDDGRREMSSKVLADVVEALIGAAYVDGALEKSFTCIRTLLPDEEWNSHQDSISRFLEGVQPSKIADLTLLQQLIGHHFNNLTLLVEAITHVSFPHNRTGLSYERLEFLGDVVLDLIIVPKLFAHPRNLRHWELHRVRNALVNGNFLAFCCMDYATEEDRYDVAEEKSIDGLQFEVKKSTRLIHLHDFLRAGGPVIKIKRQSLESFEKLRSAVRDDLEHSSKYPWPDLMAMRPPKFTSDIVESVLGAIYLDTVGDVSVCEAFLEKLGILKYMRRILDDNIETAFPKEQVGILAGQDTVEYVVSRNEEVDGRKTFDCTVKVGEVDVVVVKNCGSKHEVEARAAREAARILQAKIAADGAVNHRKRKLDIVIRDAGTINEDMNDEIKT